ncbi:hypothetical protein NHH03_10390 [Stieleria sp. TO1_6]|uniref:hypothetical protein n=1 Tax=Stieleria tagensis TaxID=2956795 RepID=UPI00209AB375|nr:hypothetical protein [Stieleria tagensis]MCO8122147.1 hypothetical protein [Stieleria tagensis]
MIKTFRLEFISKKPASLKSTWKDVIDDGLLSNNMGVLTGTFRSNSSELSRVIELYNRDKQVLKVRMEASCQVVYEDADIESHALFKLYPPKCVLECIENRKPIHCDECGKIAGFERLETSTFTTGNVDSDTPVAITEHGDLVLRNDLVDQIESIDGLRDMHLAPIDHIQNFTRWSILLSAPTAGSSGTRVGYCHKCGGAIKTEMLPEVDETYTTNFRRDFMISPDRPGLPCFSKSLAKWLIDSSPRLSWDDFKPIGWQRADDEVI